MRRLIALLCLLTPAALLPESASAGQVCTCHMSGRCDEFGACTDGVALDWCLESGADAACERLCTQTHQFDYSSLRSSQTECTGGSKPSHSTGAPTGALGTDLHAGRYMRDAAGCEYLVAPAESGSLQLVPVTGHDGKPLCLNDAQ